MSTEDRPRRDGRRAPVLVRNVVAALAVCLAALLGPPAAGAARTGASNRLPKTAAQVRVVVTSADLHQALTELAPLPFLTKAPHGTPIVTVNERQRYQTIKGVGGAMTDTSAWLIENELTAATRAWLMRRLFGRDGLDLRFIRVPMGGSDFTVTGTPYTYDDMPAGQTDPTLAHFTIVHDTFYILPALRQALSLDPHAFVVATPWSPPAWMKTNDLLGNPMTAMGWLQPADYGVLAQYFVKFLQAYAADGVNVGAVTPQNEPGQLTAYPGMNMTETNEATFIADDLAPALRAAALHTEIYGYDNNWYDIGVGFGHALERSRAAADLTGIASHCYFGIPTVVAALHDQAPKLDEIVSECSPGTLPFSTSQIEIAAIRNWASAVALWNFALDQAGGPVEQPNYGCLGCTGIVTINDDTHTVTLTRDYYELGQLSRYVRPGAVRIASNNFVTYKYFPIVGSTDAGRFSTPGLDDVAFQNPDGTRVLLAYNSAAAPFQFAGADDGYYFRYRLQPGSTATFVWKAPASGGKAG